MNKERISALFFFIVGVYAFLNSIQIRIGTLNEPGAGLYPLILSILLSLTSAAVFVFESQRQRIDWLSSVMEPTKVYKIILLSAGFALLMQTLGYLFTTTFYMFALFVWVSRLRLRTAIMFTVALVLGSWLFFAKLLRLHLPPGILGL